LIVVTESEREVAAERNLPSSNNTESNGIMEETELNSKINSDLFVPNKVSKQSTKKG